MKNYDATHNGLRRDSRAGREPMPITDRFAFTVAEFASLFGRSATWGYRQIYHGAVKPIGGAGRLLISRSEIDKLIATATEYGREGNGDSQL